MGAGFFYALTGRNAARCEGSFIAVKLRMYRYVSG